MQKGSRQLTEDQSGRVKKTYMYSGSCVFPCRKGKESYDIRKGIYSYVNIRTLNRVAYYVNKA